VRRQESRSAWQPTCVRPMTRPVQDQPSPLDMRLQAKLLALDSDASLADRWNFCITRIVSNIASYLQLPGFYVEGLMSFFARMDESTNLIQMIRDKSYDRHPKPALHMRQCKASKPSEGSAGWACDYALINAGKPHKDGAVTDKASGLLMCIALPLKRQRCFHIDRRVWMSTSDGFIAAIRHHGSMHPRTTWEETSHRKVDFSIRFCPRTFCAFGILLLESFVVGGEPV
jgi:hypothetical protein